MIYQLAQASNQKNVEFASITSGSGTGASTAASPASASASAASAGFKQMPFTFVFNGSFFDLYNLFQQLNRFTLRTTSGGLRVSGRLLTVQSVKLAPAISSGGGTSGSGNGQSEQLSGTITATAYVLPAGQIPHRRSDIHGPRRHDDADGVHQRVKLAQSPGPGPGEPMSDFLHSLKSDLLDKRFLPVLALLGAALVAALAYAVLGGGSSTHRTSLASSGASSGGATVSTGITIHQVTTNPNEAVSETTSGSSDQHSGHARNPFTPLPSSKPKATAAASSTTSSGGSSTGSSSGSSGSSSGSSGSSSGASQGSGGTSTSGTSPEPAKPKPPRQVYQVNVLFGVAPAGTPSQNIQLTSFNDLTRLDPLTAGGEAPLVFAGVTAGGHSAVFTLVREVILHGPAVCRPSASQCQAIQLAPSQSEELEYVQPSGQALIYKIALVSITPVKASAAKAARVFHAESKAGRDLLRRAGLSALPGLRYSLDKGVVVVLRGHRAFGAHAARRRR